MSTKEQIGCNNIQYVYLYCTSLSFAYQRIYYTLLMIDYNYIIRRGDIIYTFDLSRPILLYYY